MRGQLFTIDLLAAAVIITLALGAALYLDSSTKANYARNVESQTSTAEALAEFLNTNQTPPNPPTCWCVTERTLASTEYDNCSSAACLAGCKNVFSTTRLTTQCLNTSCTCNASPCSLEVKAC